jgi:hypothetical protein
MTHQLNISHATSMPPPASFAPWTPIGDGSPVVLMEALLGYGSSDSDGDGSDHDQPPSKPQKVAGAGQISSACVSAAPDCAPPATDEPAGPHGAAPAVLPSAAEVLGAGGLALLVKSLNAVNLKIRPGALQGSTAYRQSVTTRGAAGALRTLRATMQLMST